MIIQNGNRPSPEPQIMGRTGDDVAKAVASSVAPPGRGNRVEVPQVAAAPVVDPQAASEKLKKVVEDINRAMQQSSRNLEFSVDASTKQVVVKMTDMETGEVIRQFPSDEALAISRSIGEFQQGMLLKQKA